MSDNEVIEEVHRVKRLEIGALIAIASIIFGGGITYGTITNAQTDIAALKQANDKDQTVINDMSKNLAEVNANVKILLKDRGYDAY